MADAICTGGSHVADHESTDVETFSRSSVPTLPIRSGIKASSARRLKSSPGSHGDGDTTPSARATNPMPLYASALTLGSRRGHTAS